MKTKIINKLAFLVLLSYAVIFNSCDFGSAKDLTKKTYETQIQTVLPQQYKPVASDKSERSATPAFSSLVYNITATCTDENTTYSSKTKSLTSSELTNNITLPLETGNWSIAVTVYDSSDSQKNTVFAGSATLLVTEFVQTNPLIINLEVYKDNNGNVVEGNGGISVDIYWNTSKIAKFTYKLTGNEYSDTLHSNTFTPVVGGGGYSIEYSDIPAKSTPYLLTVLFYDSDNLLIYSLQSSISVFANLVSGTWRNELELDTTEGSPTKGKILITDEHLEAYKTKYIYVKNVETGEPFGVGSYYSPYKVLQDAINKVLSLNDGTSTYYIFVDGTVCENSTLTLTSGEINLVIRGYNNALLDCSESPYSSVISFEGAGTKNIELNGISIISGLSSGNGGGINTEHTNLTLSNCTIGINECDANYNGGGIYVSNDSTLTLKGTNQIIDNEKTGGHIASNVYLCAGATINIDGNISGSNIGITVADEPTEQKLTRIITTGFNGSSTNFPAACFTSDQEYQIGMVGTEAALVMSKGTVNPVITENVKFSLGIQAFAETSEDEILTINPKAYVGGINITAETGFSWKTIEIYNSTGDNVTSDSAFTVSKTNNTATITFNKKGFSIGDDLTFFLKAEYNGLIYGSSGCKIKILKGYSASDAASALPTVASGQSVDLFITDTNPDLTTIAAAISNSADAVCLDLSSCTDLTSIPDTIFKNNKKIETIILPASVTSIAANAFEGCSKLQVVVLSDNVTSIGGSAFKYCTDLKEIEIPGTIETIRGDTFSNCTKLEKIVLGYGVKNISGYAFADCTMLKEIEIPASITALDDHAFESCTTLKKLKLPDSLIIEWNPFIGCNNIEEINVYTTGNTVNLKVSENLLISNGDKIIIEYNVPEEINFNDAKYNNLRFNIGCYRKNSKIKKVTIGDTLVNSEYKSVIPAYMFANCQNLEEIIIPNTITEIGLAAFVNCTSLTTITIPASITKIVNETFNNCSNLTSIVFEDTASTWKSVDWQGNVLEDSISVSDSSANVEKFRTYDKTYIKNE